jgi:hypothetical protein
MTVSTGYHQLNLTGSNLIRSIIITYCSKIHFNIVLVYLSLDCPSGLILLKCYKLACRRVIFYGLFNKIDRRS